jgi:hypothetical protein
MGYVLAAQLGNVKPTSVLIPHITSDCQPLMSAVILRTII